MAGDDRLGAALQGFGLRGAAEAEVEVHIGPARNDVFRARACRRVGYLQRSRREVAVPVIPLFLAQRGRDTCHTVDRVVGELRVGDVTLLPNDAQFRAQRAAAAVA